MKLLMTLTLAVLLAGNAFAQSIKGQAPDPAERATQATERMTKQLDLDPEQSRRVNSVFLKSLEQQEDRKAEEPSNITAEEKEKLTEGMDADLKAILTPDQYEKWMKLQEVNKHQTNDGREIHEVQPME